MKIRKELPLAIEENLCRLYLNYQDLNSICFLDKHYKNFFFSNYINVYSSNLEWYKFQYIPDNKMLYSGRYVDTMVVDSTIFRNQPDMEEIKQYILQLLDKEYYVEIYVDEYYLPGTLFYNSEHYPHQQLLYGYDLLEKEFMILGINGSGQTQSFRVSFDLFLSSMFILQNEYFKQFQFEQILNFPHLRLYRKNPEWVDFDIRIIVKELENYLKSEDVFTLFSNSSRSISFLNMEHKIFSGISVYDSFIEYIETLPTTEKINVPFYFGLKEHLEIMKYRIQYVFKFSGVSITNLTKKEMIREFDSLIVKHSQFVNLCTRENMRFPRIGDRNRLMSVAGELKNEVFILYSKVLEMLTKLDYKDVMNNNRYFFGVVGLSGDLLPKVE